MGNYILILIRMFMLPGLENHKLQEHDFPLCIRGFPLKLWPVLSQRVFFPNRRRCSAYNIYYRNQKTRAIAVFTTVGCRCKKKNIYDCIQDASCVQDGHCQVQTPLQVPIQLGLHDFQLQWHPAKGISD